jgi:ATP/maltotriose-dependent transcriptional regulator MalT
MRPTRSERFLPRAALIDRLAGDAQPGLVVLAAPAGYGKTWLGAQVARRWESESAPVRTWRLQHDSTMPQALRSLGGTFGIEQVDDAERVLAQLRRRLPGPSALIVDIDGAPPTKAIQSLVARVVLELAPGRRTLVSGRNAWLLPVDRLSVLLPLRFHRAADLAIQPDELEAPRTDAWWQLTEGWPVLCGESSEAELEALVGGVGPYLEHELLAPLQPAEIKLLMQVSIVPTVEPGMLEALELGATWSRLAALTESGLPLSRTQSDWDRVVLHPVLRRFLQRRLLAHVPVAYRTLQRRAAHYFAAAGRFVDAMRHAQQTGDPALEAQITERSGGWRLSLREGLQALGPASASAGPELATRFPKAALARIYWQAQTGRIEEARQALERLEANPQALDRMGHDIASVRAVIAVYRDEEVDDDRIRQLGEPRHDPADEEPLLFPGAATLQAALLNNAGRYERAARAARVAIVEADAQGSHYVAYYGQIQHALALLGQGRCDEAAPPLQQAQTLALELFGEASSECRTIDLLGAHAAWLAGRDDEAERKAGDLAGLNRLHAWLEPYARILQVAMAIARSRGGRTLEDRVLEEVDDLATRRSLPRLRALVSIARARRDLDEGRGELAEAACDAAIGSTSDARASAAARVLASAWLVKARCALGRAAFDVAGQAMAQFERWNGEHSDGVLALEGGLIASYLALRERRHRDAAQRFTQCVSDAQRGGLRRPFLDNAAWVDDLVRHARSHPIPIEPHVLALAAEYAKAGATGATPAARLTGAMRGGLLLTQRETDILQCLAQGLSSKEMARRLSITEATVKTHRKHLYEKLGVGLRSQAIVKARELGVL